MVRKRCQRSILAVVVAAAEVVAMVPSGCICPRYNPRRMLLVPAGGESSVLP